MKAAVLSSPGEVAKRPLQIREIPQPKPSAGQALLRVRACGVCRTDLRNFKASRIALLDAVEFTLKQLNSNFYLFQAPLVTY